MGRSEIACQLRGLRKRVRSVVVVVVAAAAVAASGTFCSCSGVAVHCDFRTKYRQKAFICAANRNNGERKEVAPPPPPHATRLERQQEQEGLDAVEPAVHEVAHE